MKDYKPYLGSEADFQKTLAKYLDSVGLEWFHPANGELRNKATASKLKAMGVKAGVPDIIIISSPASSQYKGMVIELKVGKNYTRESQDIWIKKFRDNGWNCLVTWSLDRAIEEINKTYNL